MPAARKPLSIRVKLAPPEVAVPRLPADLPDDVEALKASPFKVLGTETW